MTALRFVEGCGQAVGIYLGGTGVTRGETHWEEGEIMNKLPWMQMESSKLYHVNKIR